MGAENPGYKVLLVRKLNTGNSDDLQFSPSEVKQVTLDIFLTDNDDINLIGEANKKLTFLKK